MLCSNLHQLAPPEPYFVTFFSNKVLTKLSTVLAEIIHYQCLVFVHWKVKLINLKKYQKILFKIKHYNVLFKYLSHCLECNHQLCLCRSIFAIQNDLKNSVHILISELQTKLST